jgi:primosomal protein N' (replication factor Y)
MYGPGDIVAVMVGVAVEGPYSYRVPEGMQVTRGAIVVVPLGPRATLGVVWGAPKDTVAHNRLRDIVHTYDVPALSDEHPLTTSRRAKRKPEWRSPSRQVRQTALG